MNSLTSICNELRGVDTGIFSNSTYIYIYIHIDACLRLFMRVYAQSNIHANSLYIRTLAPVQPWLMYTDRPSEERAQT